MAQAPTRIGPYDVLSRIGMGGMAETYVAVRRGPGAFVQRVCLKRIRDDLDRDPEFIRQFMAEATLAARLRHATIASVLDFGQSGDDYFMALELIDGLDLREILEAADSGLSSELVLQIAIELTTALDFAHRGGGTSSDGAIVHRDISPSNTLISLEGEVKLTDFGIARSLAEPAHTRTGVVKGKVPYLAPEYARTGRFDTRCDLYSLGVLLYECLCGERPHDAETDLETLERATRGQHVWLPERVPGAADLAEIVEQLLSPQPELRYQSAGALLEALSALPPPPRARRELGALVTALRNARSVQHAAQSSAAALPVPSSDRRGPVMNSSLTERWANHTERLPHPQTKASPDSKTYVVPGLRRGRGPMVALATAIALALGVATYGIKQRRSLVTQSGSHGGPARPTRTKDDAAPPTAEASTPTPQAQAEQGWVAPTEPSQLVVRPEAVPEPTVDPMPKHAPRGASVEIVVLPYGDVSIDGNLAGRAPITVPLKPGPHTISARSGSRTMEQQMVLKPGEHRSLVLH